MYSLKRVFFREDISLEKSPAKVVAILFVESLCIMQRSIFVSKDRQN